MKDAKGHGSNKRGGGGYDPGPVPQGKLFAARQAMKAANSTESWEARYGTQADRDRLQADAINAGVDAGFKTARSAAGLSGSDKIARIAQAHGIQGGPIKVQTLNTKLSGVPFETKKSYRNNTIAEHVAKYMRIDGEHTRIKVRR